MRRVARHFVLFCLAGLLLSSCALSQVPVSEQVEVLTAGEQRQLRKPMRPPRGPPRVLVFAIDGVGGKRFRQIVETGHAPHVAELFGPRKTSSVYAHGYMAPDALSVLPSNTIPAWSTVFTGAPPACHGVPGNEWYERRSMRFFAPAPVSIDNHEQAVRMITDSLVGHHLDAPTLFQRAPVRSYVSTNQIFRGADMYTAPDVDSFIPFVGEVVQGAMRGEQPERALQNEMDDQAVDSAVDAINEHGLADLQVVYFGGIDLFTHDAVDRAGAQMHYFEDVVDPGIDKVLTAYRKRGALERTYVVFVSDHGHVGVLRDERHALDGDGRGTVPALLERLGFRLRPAKLHEPPPGERDYQAVLAYQGAMAFIYLADRSTCPRSGVQCDWRRPPRFERDVLPVARALFEANRTGRGASGLRGTLDLVLVRKPVAERDWGPYEVFDGEKLVPIDAYLAAHGRDDLVDLDRRLRDLAVGPHGERAGDILVLTNTGFGRRIEDRYYFASEKRSWHGSATRGDSNIILSVANPRSTGSSLRRRLRQLAGEHVDQHDVTPLVLDLLGYPHKAREPSCTQPEMSNE